MTQIQTRGKIVFIGNSITDCGREEEFPPLGNGYVRIFTDMLTVREPEKDIMVVNRGISGDTIKDLQDRWQRDVIDLAPDWLDIPGSGQLQRGADHA